MDSVVYLKLVTGEDIFGVVADFETWSDQVIVNNPHVLETFFDPAGIRYMVMNRYAPYSKEKVVTIAKDKIVARGAADELTAEYYLKSRTFSENTGDGKYVVAMKTAIEQFRDTTQDPAPAGGGPKGPVASGKELLTRLSLSSLARMTNTKN